MEFNGAVYLYALTSIGMAFLGFTAIVVIIRQSLGAGLSQFQLLITQVLIEHGFADIGRRGCTKVIRRHQPRTKHARDPHARALNPMA